MNFFRRLPWFPLITLLIATCSVVYLRALPEFERNLKGWLSAAIPLVALILILVWFGFSRRFYLRARLIGLGGFARKGVTSVCLEMDTFGRLQSPCSFDQGGQS